MENKRANSELSTKFISVETTIEGPKTASNGKLFMRAKFAISEDDDDGYSGQSRAYTKCFFEDTHSLQFIKAKKAVEENLPIKIKGAKITKDLFTGDGENKMPRLYYVTDEEGKKRMNQDKEPITTNRLAGFFLSDENPEAYFNNQVKRITRAGMWVEMPTANDEADLSLD